MREAPPAYEGPLLEVTDLRTHFLTPRGRVRAVDGVTLSLDRGVTLGVVGESGSGKTIFARSIMNLLPRENVWRSGTVRFMGQDLTSMPAKEMRRISGAQMAMVFQDPMSSLNPVMTIGKQIGESLRLHLGMSRREANESAVAMLRAVNIPEAERRMNEYPHQLSGGMRQRVMIALALACGPRLLFADEPTTALDVTVQAEILNLLQDNQKDRLMTMVLVTHDLGVVAGRTDQIAVMYAGRIVEHARTDVLFSRMRHPYTEALLRSIPRIEDPSHTRLRVIIGRPPNLINPPPGCPFNTRCPYAQERCREEMPPLAAPGVPDHRFACFYPLGTPENAAALQRNLADGLPQAMALLDSPIASLNADAVAPPGVENATDTTMTVHGQGGAEVPAGTIASAGANGATDTAGSSGVGGDGAAPWRPAAPGGDPLGDGRGGAGGGAS